MTCKITYEELAAFAAGDMDAERINEIRQHLQTCKDCQQRLEAIRDIDSALGATARRRPSAAAILATRKALSEVTRPQKRQDIMTLGQVAEFLQISDSEMGEVASQLPAFELGGQIRVRREKLIEWIRTREAQYRRQSAASWAARANTPFEGVA